VFLLRRLLLAVCALALLTAPVALADPVGSADAGASKKQGGKKPARCKKGHVRKTVTTKSGKKVKRCVKKPGPKPPPPPPPADTGLFPDPGRTLEGDEAKDFLKPYLPNSVFTDCVTGWPSCGGFENRYSHWADASFYQCWLRPTSGSDVKSVGEYGVLQARVNPDGSWIVKEVVGWYGHQNLFEWQVTDRGVVTGANQSDSGGAPEAIGPLQYVANRSKDCGY
jgi:hypothetical protein